MSLIARRQYDTPVWQNSSPHRKMAWLWRPKLSLGGVERSQLLASSCDLSTPPNDSFGLHNQAIFLCGDEFCHTGVSYCRRAISDIGGKPDHYDCQLLPSSCDGGPSTPADCACLAKEGCGDMCTVAAAEELTLTCPGG